MSKLLQDATAAISEIGFDGMTKIEASTVCDLWEKWAVANASSFSPDEWGAVVHVLCELRGRCSGKFFHPA
jgi:hypothetical protein